MTVIQFRQIEYHQVHVHKNMTINESTLLENGLTIDRFYELLSHYSDDPTTDRLGDVPSDEERQVFQEVIWEAECVDSEEDWFSDRKGGYEIAYHRAGDENES